MSNEERLIRVIENLNHNVEKLDRRILGLENTIRTLGQDIHDLNRR